MLHKQAHLSYNVTEKAFLKNFDYVMDYADKHELAVCVKQRGKIVATFFPFQVGNNLTEFFDKLEEQHQHDLFLIKQLKNEKKALELRNALADNLNHD